MNWLALSLWVLGIAGALMLGDRTPRRDVASHVKEHVVVIAWPIAIALAICLAIAHRARREYRR